MTKKDAEEKLKFLGDWLFSHNCDKKWSLNTHDIGADKIGRLQISHTMMSALQLTVGDLVKKGVDPLAVDQGVIFDLQRFKDDKGIYTNRVLVVMEEFTPPGMNEKFERIKKAPLTPEFLKRMETEAWDLKDMFRKVTADEVARLVSSGGDASVVDSVFSAPEGKRDVATPGVGQGLGSMLAPAAVEDASSEPDEDDISALASLPVAPAAPEVTAPVEEDADEAALNALLAKKAAKAAAATKPATAAPAAGKAKPSNADFLAQFGGGKV